VSSHKQFDHEKLKVYQLAISFVSHVEGIREGLPKSLAVSGQLDRASTSIPFNIAEGNGKFTPADRCFFDIVRGSALESAACMDVLVAKKLMEPSAVEEGKELLVNIVSMFVGLIRANSDTRTV
jgi:four helix bundle protein